MYGRVEYTNVRTNKQTSKQTGGTPSPSPCHGTHTHHVVRVLGKYTRAYKTSLRESQSVRSNDVRKYLVERVNSVDDENRTDTYQYITYHCMHT